LTPLTHLVGVLDQIQVQTLETVLIPAKVSILGDPSPPLSPTLLRLHCALNT
jgi:hypothetical protein